MTARIMIVGVSMLVVSAAIAADDDNLPEIFTAGPPIWSAGSVRNEPLLFIQEEGQTAATAKLFYAPSDSITEGYNASGFKMVNVPPYQPPYPQLVANTLRGRFGGEVSVVNLSKPGKRAGWGMGRVEQVNAEKPDLVILAFGMNHNDPADRFGAAMRRLLDAVKAGNPGADVVLVTSMCANPGLSSPEKFAAYRDVQLDMAGPGVAVADVTSVWMELIKNKNFSDLSGNNVNHPNDFSHRLYAQVILQLFEE